ncbi:F-box/WD repeat-containing protein 7 [Chlorella vulgaris]
MASQRKPSFLARILPRSDSPSPRPGRPGSPRGSSERQAPEAMTGTPQASVQPPAAPPAAAVPVVSAENSVQSLEGHVIPTSFVCPVSMEIMVDPVILATGHTYDRHSIERWLAQGHKTCPVTGMRLRHLELTPNFALRSAIVEWGQQHGVKLPERVKQQAVQPVFKWDESRAGNILQGHSEIIWAIEVLGNRVYTASADKTVRVWDMTTKRCLQVLESHTRPVLSLAIAGGRLFSGSYDYTIRVWNLETLQREKTLTGHTDAVRSLTVAGNKVFSASYDGKLKVWDAETLTCLATLSGHSGPVRTLVRCGDKVFSGSYDKTVRVWDTNTHQCLATLVGHSGAVRALAATDTLVFSGSDDTTIRVWDAATLTCLRTLEGHEDNVRVLAVGQGHLFSGSWDKTVRVWSCDSLACVKVLEGHSEAVLALAVGDLFMASGSYDTTIRFWDLASWQCVRKAEGHVDAVRVLAATAGGVISGAYDGAVGQRQLRAQGRLLNLRTRSCHLLSPTSERLVRAVAGMARADGQQEAALEMAAPPTLECQREQQRIQAPSYISPRDPRLQLSSLVDTQPRTAPALPLHSDSTADKEDSGSPESVEREDGQPLGRSSSLTQVAGSEGQQGAEDRSQRRCSHCGRSSSGGQWRRHPTTRAWLCSACGMYAKTHDGSLPTTAVLQRREQQRQVVAASKLRRVPPDQRQCLQCGADTPGTRQCWLRHPATKEEWLCHKCYEKAWKQLKRKRQQEAAEEDSSSGAGSTSEEESVEGREAPPHRKAATVAHHQAAPAQPAMPGPPSWHNRPAAAAATISDCEEEAWEEGEEAQPPSQSPPAPQQQAALVQPLVPGPAIQQRLPAYVIADRFAEAKQQQLQALSQLQQQPQAVTPDAAWEPVTEKPALLPANMTPPQASTGLLVLEAVQHAAAAAVGLTEGLAGTFAALLPLPAEQDECLCLMLQRRQYSVAGMDRADVQQEAAPETAAPPTVERQREQQRIKPRDPRLQLTGLADLQPRTTPALPLHSDSTAGQEDSGSPVPSESEQGQAESSDWQPPSEHPAGSEEQHGAEEGSQRQCSHCGSPIPGSCWYRHPTTRALLCSACGQYARANDGRLPSAALLQRRVQQRKAVPPNQRQCLQCGASTPGAGCNWTRHPATKEEWLCNRCYQRANYQLKKRRQREAAEEDSSSGAGSTSEEESVEGREAPPHRKAATVAHHQAAPAQPAMPGPPSWHNRPAAAAAPSTDSEEEESEEGEEAQPPTESAPSPKQQSAPVQSPVPGPPVQQRVPAFVIADQSAEAKQQQLQALSQLQQQPQAVTPDAAWEPAPEQPALLPANMTPPQASTGLLVMEAAQQAAAAAAGLTEGLAGTFVALLPMSAEQDECLRLMLQRRQYSGAAGLMRAALHQRAALALLLCALLGGASAAELGDRMAATVDGIKQVHEAKVSGARAVHEALVSGARAVHEQKVSLLRSQLSAKAAKLSGSAAATASTSASASTTVTAMSTPTAIPANCLSVAEAAGLSSALSDRSLKATVFAPSDEAFEAALADLGMTSAQLLVDTEMLQAILKYHVVPGDALTSADLRDEEKLPTLLAADLEGAAEGEEDGVLTVQIQQVYSLAGRSSRVKVDGSLSSAVVVMPDVNAGCPAVVHVIDNVLLPDVADDPTTETWCVRAVAGMERAGVQQAAALETAAPPTVERQREQHRSQEPADISPRDPRLQLSSLAEKQPPTLPAQPLLPGSVAAAVDTGSPVSVDSEQGQPEGSEGQQAVEEQRERLCSHCGSPNPAGQWYRHPTTRAFLCSTCWKYARNHNGRLPSAAVLQRRMQQRQVVAASKQRRAVPPNQRQCLQCGSSTPGAGCDWRRHPATKEEWMCSPCYQREHMQLKRKRQRKAAATPSSSDDGEGSWGEGEQAQPPSQSPPQQQAAPVQPPVPGPPVEQQAPAIVSADGFAEAGQQQHLQALSQQQQQQQLALNPDTTWETVPEHSALLPANTPPPQASTGLLVLEAAQQAAAAAAGLTEGLAGTFAALLPMPAEQDECLRLMLQRRQYSGAAKRIRAMLHMAGIPPPKVC